MSLELFHCSIPPSYSKMTSVTKRVQNSIKGWYLRYLLATDLYIVEPWEKVVIHVLFALLFAAFWYFNYVMVASDSSELKHGHALVDSVL
ncbi:unnamed protein product [Plutella xylostella]|uniref:(diamondback moth) hypothetical protein n=1 Tax=Plutella xylostella TaxID=51655 RepID=A0A8S4EN84_PLUXY|nr:unnamed protein product [Plutella xylostella]